MAFESCNTNIKSNVRAQYPERCRCTINIREYKNVPLTFIFTAERQKRDLSLSRWSVVKLRGRRSRASFRKAARSKKSPFFQFFSFFFPPKRPKIVKKIQSQNQEISFHKPAIDDDDGLVESTPREEDSFSCDDTDDDDPDRRSFFKLFSGFRARTTRGRIE